MGSVLNDKWTLERLIGIGGMAAVYSGLHRNGARAAVKVLHADVARIAQVRERFLREGYAANRVEHPGAVKVLDDDIIASGPDQGSAYLVMELLRGESLESRLGWRKPPMSERQVLLLARAVLSVLEAAHAHGVVHRDLKPENLFLPEPEEDDDPKVTRVKILDFGLARVADARLRTMSGFAVGTPSYMPPEQAAGRIEEIDGRSDLFALGATCFRILAGRTVHPGKNAVEIAVKMAKEPAPKLHVVAPSVSPATAAVINRALEYQREDRWPDAASMRAGVDAALAELDAKPKAAPKPAAQPPALPKVAQPDNEPRRVRRSRMPILTLLLLLVVGGKVLQEELDKRDNAQRNPKAEPVDAAAAAQIETLDAGPSAPPHASTRSSAR